MGSLLSLFPSQHRLQELYKALGNKKDVLQNLRNIGLSERSLLQLLEFFNFMDIGNLNPSKANPDPEQKNPTESFDSCFGPLLLEYMHLAPIDHSGSITIGEFFAYMELDHTPFCSKAFALMDKDGSGEVDFIEFVMNLWNYCSLGKLHLVRYAFDLYDRDGSGEIENKEVQLFLREVWGSNWASNPRAIKVLDQIETLMSHNPSGCLSHKQFEQYCDCHPMLLFPAFELQSELQSKILGERFWRNAAKRRAKLDPRDHTTDCFNQIVQMAHAISRRQLPVDIRRPSVKAKERASRTVPPPTLSATAALAHDGKTSPKAHSPKAKQAVAVTNDGKTSPKAHSPKANKAVAVTNDGKTSPKAHSPKANKAVAATSETQHPKAVTSHATDMVTSVKTTKTTTHGGVAVTNDDPHAQHSITHPNAIYTPIESVVKLPSPPQKINANGDNGVITSYLKSARSWRTQSSYKTTSKNSKGRTDSRENSSRFFKTIKRRSGTEQENLPPPQPNEKGEKKNLELEEMESSR